MRKIKVFLASAALLMAGWVLYTNEANVEEFRGREALGIGLMVLAGVFFLSVFAGGGLKMRMQSLMFVVVGLFFAGVAFRVFFHDPGAGADKWETAAKQHGAAKTIAIAVIGLFGALSVPFNLWRFLAGSPPASAATQ